MGKKADMGIGTLIIFIGMILVASIAASVLIQTGTSLQNRALLSGSRTEARVGSYVEPISLSGSNGTNNYLEDFRLMIKLAPGAQPSTLLAEGGVMLSYGGASLSGDYTYLPNASCQRATEGEDDGYCFNESEGVGTFTVNYLQTGSSHIPGSIVPGDVLEICFQAPGRVYEDNRFIVTFVPASGSPMQVETSTPHTMERERIQLFP